MKLIDTLRFSADALDRAMHEEGIDSSSSLAVWGKAQRDCLNVMILIAENFAERIDDRTDAVERAMNTQIERVKVEIERCRQETQRLQAVTGLAVEERKKDSQELAKELSKLISKGIKEATLIREKRFNRMQNWSAAGFLAFCLLSCFVGGQVWTNHKLENRVIERCERAQVSAGGTTWCDMDIIRGK
ncbi:MAG: hypothetical protein ACRYF2_04715 [Janthinobacterium lividum]